MSRRGRHSAEGGRLRPSLLFSILDQLDDLVLLLVGVPLVLGVAALWEWRPLAAVVAVSMLVVTTVAGGVYLARGTEEASWGQAVAAALALVAATAALLFVTDVAGSALLHAVAWPFRWLLGYDQM